MVHGCEGQMLLEPASRSVVTRFIPCWQSGATGGLLRAAARAASNDEDSARVLLHDARNESETRSGDDSATDESVR